MHVLPLFSSLYVACLATPGALRPNAGKIRWIWGLQISVFPCHFACPPACLPDVVIIKGGGHHNRRTNKTHSLLQCSVDKPHIHANTCQAMPTQVSEMRTPWGLETQELSTRELTLATRWFHRDRAEPETVGPVDPMTFAKPRHHWWRLAWGWFKANHYFPSGKNLESMLLVCSWFVNIYHLHSEMSAPQCLTYKPASISTANVISLCG